jgi:hypothetical protein
LSGWRNEFDDHLTTVGFAGVAGTATALAAPPAKQAGVLVVCFAIVVAITIWKGRKILGLLRKIWSHRLGLKGEQAVAEELNQLLADGFKVFHDVPFDGYNIDHVIVGPPGIYAVETKTRRKRSDIKGLERATVEVIGDRLEFSGQKNEDAVPQARRNAKALGEWLTAALAERVVAGAIVTIPGWWVNRRQVHDVNVLNPEEIKRSFPDRPRHPLSEQQIQRIAHHLAERCRTEREK